MLQRAGVHPGVPGDPQLYIWQWRRLALVRAHDRSRRSHVRNHPIRRRQPLVLLLRRLRHRVRHLPERLNLDLHPATRISDPGRLEPAQWRDHRPGWRALRHNVDVADGDTAITRFARMARGEISGDDIEVTRRQLLNYCKLDTFAMVRLHETLAQLAAGHREPITAGQDRRGSAENGRK